MTQDKHSILIVEDHEALRTAIGDILEADEYTVFAASDGLQALQLMQDASPDLIVADIMMPRMNGYDLYTAVRARAEWVQIPFIFLTAKAEREDVLRGKELGAEDYLTKPFDPQELLVAVRSRLKRARDIQRSAETKFDQLKQQIITVLGHELRTPVTYVLGYTDLAVTDLESLSTDEIQDLLLGAKHGADRLAQLVEDLLLLIRLDSGQAVAEFDELAQVYDDWGGMIEAAVYAYERQAAANNITLQVRAPAKLPPVQLCELFFVDALGRLVDNGIKFSPGGKSVSVTAQAVGEWVEVAVRDEGVGISATDMPHLFERFRQFGREEMEQQGRGLGLAIAQELIHLHGGEIVVESKSGDGSTFTIRLPLAGAEQVTA